MTRKGEEVYEMTKQPYVYILASKRNGTLYIGVTSNLIQRIWQHKNNQVDGFTKKYNQSCISTALGGGLGKWLCRLPC